MSSEKPPLMFEVRFGALHPINTAARDALKKSYPNARRDTIERLHQRFDSMVDVHSTGECWPWKGYCRPSGYGMFSVGKTPVQATHIALLLSGQPRPPTNNFALHSCDNPTCCNPAHLRWGSAADNECDRRERGRTVNPKGEHHGQSKLTDDQVRYIRTCGKTLAALKQELGVSLTVLSLARSGKTWRHVQ